MLAELAVIALLKDRYAHILPALRTLHALSPASALQH